jgi:TonB family protein
MSDHTHDIEKYRRGELTPAEMHALEKKALTDPFLADALEGIESIESLELAADLEEIQASLHNRVNEKQRVISPWGWAYRIAAGLLLIALTTYLIMSLSDEHENSNLALNKQENITPESKVLDQLDVAKDEPKPQAEIATEAQKEIAGNTSARKPKQTRLREDMSVEQQMNVDATQSEELASGDADDQPVPIVTEPEQVDKLYSYSQHDADSTYTITEQTISKSPALTTVTPDRAKRKEESQASGIVMDKPTVIPGIKTGKVVKGRVLDAEDATPMPGVNVTIKDSRIGTTTDENGYFEIFMDNPKSELVFSFVGFTDVAVAVNDENKVNVEMSTDYAALSEVVVVGYAASKPGLINLENEDKNIYSYAEPKGGRKAYKSYLVQNMKYPETAIANRVEGKVTVQFIVETNGLLSDFNVLKSIGHGCDEEVIRLIKKGPTWSPAKRNDIPYRGKVKVRLRFTLPK